MISMTYFRRDTKKQDEFLRRWERQLTEKQKELESRFANWITRLTDMST